MAEPIISSTANPLIKRIRSLEQRKYREAEGAFFVEGIRPVWEACERGAEIEAVVVAPDLLTSDPARQMLDTRRAEGMRVVPVSRQVFESIAEREHPSGLGAIVRTSLRALSELQVTQESFFVALQDAGNPGNLGTIIRTVDGAGGAGVILIGHSTDPFHPTAIKASMGTLFAIPIARAADVGELFIWTRHHRAQIVTTSSRAPEVYWSAHYHLPAVVLFGSEGQGLSEADWGQGDLAVRIPMSGSADSLNLAVSVGVLLYEIQRKRVSGK